MEGCSDFRGSHALERDLQFLRSIRPSTQQLIGASQGCAYGAGNGAPKDICSPNADAYGGRFNIPLDFELLKSHVSFYQSALSEQRLPPSHPRHRRCQLQRQDQSRMSISRCEYSLPRENRPSKGSARLGTTYTRS